MKPQSIGFIKLSIVNSCFLFNRTNRGIEFTFKNFTNSESDEPFNIYWFLVELSLRDAFFHASSSSSREMFITSIFFLSKYCLLISLLASRHGLHPLDQKSNKTALFLWLSSKLRKLTVTLESKGIRYVLSKILSGNLVPDNKKYGLYSFIVLIV